MIFMQKIPGAGKNAGTDKAVMTANSKSTVRASNTGQPSAEHRESLSLNQGFASARD